MHIVHAVPMTVLSLILYNIVALIFGGDVWATHLFSLTMISGGTWMFTLGELMILLGLVFLFVEVLNSSRPTRNTIMNHVLSTVVLIIFVVEFIVVGFAATSVFFILMAIALFDVVAGFTVSIEAASRPMSYAPPIDGRS